MSQATGYLHALAVEGREERDRLLRESKWPADRLRGFAIGCAVADRRDLCAHLRQTARDTLEKLCVIDPAHPLRAEIERDLAAIDRVELEPIDLTWLEPRSGAN